MKVLTPRRLALTCPKSELASNSLVYGVPIPEDAYSEVPSFFKQATKGNDINDVVHAKVVDDCGNKLSIVSQYATVPGKGNLLYSQVVGLGKRVCALNAAPYISELVGDGWRRKYFPFCALLRLYAAQVGKYPKVSYRLYSIRLVVDVCASDIVTSRPPMKRAMVDIYNPSLPDSQFVWEVSSRAIPEVEIAIKGLPDRTYSSESECYSDTATRIFRALMSCNPEDITLRVRKGNGVHGSYGLLDLTRPQIPTGDLRSQFLLAEPDIIGDRLDPLLLGPQARMHGYWRNYLTQHALLAACDALPKLSDNSIQNISEIVSFIKALVIDHKIEMPKSLADLWLSYRYQYTTTKADVSDAIKFVKRHLDLGTLDRQIASRGSASHEINGVLVTCRCNIYVSPKETRLLAKIWRALDTFGLTPDFYVVWDSIPYSFMVDWFLPVGDLAAVWDANSKYFSGEFYTFDGISYSFSYTRKIGANKAQFYSRWKGSVPEGLNSYYWLEAPSASAETWTKRALDAASIFIG